MIGVNILYLLPCASKASSDTDILLLDNSPVAWRASRRAKVLLKNVERMEKSMTPRPNILPCLVSAVSRFQSGTVG